MVILPSPPRLSPLYPGSTHSLRLEKAIADLNVGLVDIADDVGEVNLIDEIKTSDEFLIEACDRADVISVSYQRKRTLPEKLGLATSAALEHTVWRVLGAFRNQKIQ